MLVFRVFREMLEDGVHGTRNHSAILAVRIQISLHRVSFARARLTIGKHCAIETLKNLVDQRFDCLFVHLRPNVCIHENTKTAATCLFLGGVLIKSCIVCIRLRLVLPHVDCDLSSRSVHRHNVVFLVSFVFSEAISHFLRFLASIHGSASYQDLDVDRFDFRAVGTLCPDSPNACCTCSSVCFHGFAFCLTTVVRYRQTEPLPPESCLPCSAKTENHTLTV